MGRDNKQCVAHVVRYHFFVYYYKEDDNGTRHPPFLVVSSCRNMERDNEQRKHYVACRHFIYLFVVAKRTTKAHNVVVIIF